jgi:hypothetical protein
MSLRRSSALVMPFARAISSNASPRGRGTSVLTWTTGDRLLVTICAGCFLIGASRVKVDRHPSGAGILQAPSRREGRAPANGGRSAAGFSPRYFR